MAKRQQTTSPLQPTAITSVTTIPRGRVVTFEGIVDPGNAGGGSRSGREKTWNFSATLVAWKGDGGPLVREPLDVRDSKIAEVTLNNRMKQFSRWSLVRFAAKLAPQRGWKYTPLELEKYLGKSTDPELLAVKQELERPISLDDRLFGRLLFNREACWFESQKYDAKDGFGVIFNAETLDELKRLVSLAKPFWRSRQKWFNQFKQAACEQMFDTCSDWWSEVHEAPLTKSDFMRLLGEPCSVTFYDDDGDLGFTLGGWSEELFGDHGVDVCGTLSGGIRR